jgi:signal peptidase I
MAPTLQGRHGELTCLRCRFDYAFDIELQPPPARLACPNCGQVHDAPEIRELPGQRVLIDPAPLWWSRPQRMQIIAFQHPESPGELAVKRVVGLPGETIKIRGGEVYVDGRLWQKPLKDQQVLRVLVHDDAFLAEDGASPWRGEGWRVDAKAGSHRSDSAASTWMEFHPPRVADLPAEVEVPPTITDYDAYNPALDRTVFEVFDLALRGRVDHSGKGRARWRIDDGWQLWELSYDFASHTAALNCNGESVATIQDARPPALGVDFEVAAVDQQIVLALDGKLVLHHPYDAGGGERRRRGALLALQCEGERMTVSRLRVERDTYWLDPGGLGEAWTSAKLGADEYLVLGDNVTVSTDSRHFGPVRAAAMRGVVLP